MYTSHRRKPNPKTGEYGNCNTIEDFAQITTEIGKILCSVWKGVRTGEPEVLSIGGVAIGTLGNFSASIGKAKRKKTFNVSAMVAAALSGKEVLNYTTDFPIGWKEPHPYIDTEQSQNHCMIVMHRIMKLAELPANEDCDRFLFFSLYASSIRRSVWLL